ncbi:MAG: glycosyltransferase family 4 protein [Candidatus Levybacteria bacterium]|nr:glycosyltransferase family 4 protein [Candidatus Levybacteria bacterium]
MKIGIDANEGNIKDKVGISEYVYELILEFSKLASVDRIFTIYLKRNQAEDFPQEKSFWRYCIFGPKKFWTQFALPLKLFINKDRPDVFFSPAHYAPRFSPVPTVISIMDLAFFHFPEYFTKKDLTQLHSWTSYSIKNAKAIITISEASKNDIIKFYQVSKEKIHVIYPGIKNKHMLEPHLYSLQKLQNTYQIPKNYILFVGTLQPRKNINRLIEAFSKLLKEKGLPDDLSLVIVGKKGWKYEEILAAPEKYGVEDKVIFLDFVKNEDLQLLYEHAQVFAWPSLYEGFGLPVLEAMKYGCPVVTSNVSSLPEAGGDAALYVDPTKVDDIEKKMYKVLSDKKLRSDMIEKGKNHIKKFSWENAAKQTLSVLEQVVHNSR